MQRPHGARILRTLCLASVLGLGMRGPGVMAQTRPNAPGLERRVDIGYGQLQVGGPYVGAEFHHSRPVPSRVSFYYPVANSIDLSTDYWKRDESMPFSVVVTVNGERYELGQKPAPYRATPAWVVFEDDASAYHGRLSYRFAETLPIMVLETSVAGSGPEADTVLVETRMRPLLRTSHAYEIREPTRVEDPDRGSTYVASYLEADTDSAVVFVLNVGAAPSGSGTREKERQRGSGYDAVFSYGAVLPPGDTLRIVQLIGSCRRSEVDDVIHRALSEWQEDVRRYEQRIRRYALEAFPFHTGDPVLERTDRWSRAILEADRHYLDGRIVPMPTPAQYNFFFTHDLLLTDLGAVLFDSARVARDLRFLADLASPDSVLPHAYYWRNGQYVTELAGSDNWNHLWFVLLSASYLKHAGDRDLVQRLLPMIRQSMRFMLSNARGGLMHSERPDWWDIGHVYGARAYLTTLMIRALRSYTSLSLELGSDPDSLARYLDFADEMQRRLVAELWDERAGYLMNRLDSVTLDPHYYSGSLLAAAFGLLDEARTATLLDTARRVLLDEWIGIRNAMPPDFLDLIDRYRFNGPEVGAPYRYMNGGVWPQGIAWYALALLSAGRPDSARSALSRYLTLDGISRSPNGQPALFEYRNADRNAPDYGRIDKTTFLWAGGWYLHVLYQLAGLRESEWNLWFSPALPEGLGNVTYEVVLAGRRSHVSWSGEGPYIREIRMDGQRVHSAVVTRAAGAIVLERGRPDEPYLSRATGKIAGVDFDPSEPALGIRITGVPGMTADVEVVSATAPSRVAVDDNAARAAHRVRYRDGGYVTSVRWRMSAPAEKVQVSF